VEVPSFDNLRQWHGAIFVRKGLYRNAIFKFVIDIPPEYNDHNVWPTVKFVSPVFNPYVTTEGILDIRALCPEWDPTTHFMITVLTIIKKIFYLKDTELAGYKHAANPDARELFFADKDEYSRRVNASITHSQETVYDNQRASPLKFAQPQAAHELVRKKLTSTDEHTVRSSTVVLEACKQAREHRSQDKP